MHRNISILSLLCAMAFAAQPQTQSAQREKGQRELDPAFFGKWKLDIVKSRVDHPMSYEQRGDTIEYRWGTEHDSFKLDGKDYPTSMPGETTSWKQTGPRTYESTLKVNGKVLSKRVREISPDGQRMTITMQRGGSTVVVPYQKISGGSASNPLIGTWRAEPASAKASQPEVLTLERAPNGINYNRNGMAEFSAEFDGREHPMSGADVPPGATVRLNWINKREFGYDSYVNGKLSWKRTLALSPDGKTIAYTVTGAVGGSTVTTWEKQ